MYILCTNLFNYVPSLGRHIPVIPGAELGQILTQHILSTGFVLKEQSNDVV